MVREMKDSKRIWSIAIAIAVVAAITTTLVSWKIGALAGPAFVSGKLIASRVDESAEILQDPLKRAQFISVDPVVIENNPKLKEALAGADERYDLLISATAGYSVPTMEGHDIPITEEEAKILVSALPLAAENQDVQSEAIGTYHYVYMESNGKYYLVVIMTVGSQ